MFIIKVKCNICEKINEISYQKYNINIGRYNYYSCKGICSRQKYKETCSERYGVDNVFQVDFIKDKIKNTNLERYDVEYTSQNNEIMSRILKTNLDKYNSHYLTSVECKNAIFNKFGVDNVFKSNIIRDKIKETNLFRYGVEYPSQNYEIHKKQQTGSKAIRYKDLYYRSSYEFDFLEKFYHLGIENGKMIRFIFEDNYCSYFPDFFIKDLNLIIEIKSSYYYYDPKFYNKNIEKEKQTIKNGYNYLVIIDKDYSKLEKDYLKF